MDTRLNIKKYIAVIIIAIIFFSCKSTYNYADLDNYYGLDFPEKKSIRKSKDDEDITFWINTYKQQVFYDCLFENYKNDSISNIMEKEDLFNPSDHIPFTFWPKMREIGKNAIRYMPENDYFVETEFNRRRKFISKTCLDYFASKELDSIAKSEYKFFKKMNYYEE
jgi:hypothetical protein